MTARLNSKVAVITGGGSGIGQASVLRFLSEGASVIIADLNEASGKAVVEQAEAQGFPGRTRFIKTDVSSEDDVRAAIDLAVASFGRIDCMFNNAGIPGALGSLDQMEANEWDFTFAVLVRGPFLGIKHATKAFRKQQTGGVILNTASLAGLTGGSGPRAYSVAKAAVIHLTTIAARDFAHERIRVNAICPGAIHTAIGGKDQIERLARAQPWPDYGRAEDIAAAAAFLASDDASFITGHSLVVDGGALASGIGMEDRMGRGDSWKSMSGIHFGTTGVKGALRRVDPGQTSD